MVAAVNGPDLGSRGPPSHDTGLATTIIPAPIIPAPIIPASRRDVSLFPPHRAWELAEILSLSTATGPGGEVVIAAVGEIDLYAGAQLATTLSAALAHPSCRTLIVDLRGVRFLGAHGLGTLETTRTRAAQQHTWFAVVADSHAVLRPLQIIAPSCPVRVFPTLSAARAHEPSS